MKTFVYALVYFYMVIGVTVIEKGPIANGDARMETKFMQVEDKDGNIGKAKTKIDIWFLFYEPQGEKTGLWKF